MPNELIGSREHNWLTSKVLLTAMRAHAIGVCDPADRSTGLDGPHLSWSARVWWARQGLNLRPLPCQQNPGNRCATRRCPRSPLTVDAEGKRSLDVQLNALFHQLDPAVAARMAPPFSTDQSKHNASACIDAASIPPGWRPSVADGPTMRAMHELSGEELVDRSGATAQQLRRLVDLGIITPTRRAATALRHPAHPRRRRAGRGRLCSRTARRAQPAAALVPDR
jgi:hypothetical protein